MTTRLSPTAAYQRICTGKHHICCLVGGAEPDYSWERVSRGTSVNRRLGLSDRLDPAIGSLAREFMMVRRMLVGLLTVDETMDALRKAEQVQYRAPGA